MRGFIPPVLLILSCCGCIAQLGGGAAFATTGDGAAREALTLELRFPKAVNSAPVVGIRSAWAPSDPGALLSLRSVTGVGGWLIRPSRAWRPGFEATVETGMGQPIAHRYDGTGLYAGAAATLLFRVAAVHDSPGRYTMRILALSFDLGLGGRFGYWSPPRDSPQSGTFEGAIEASLRINVLSDTAMSRPSPREEAP